MMASSDSEEALFDLLLATGDRSAAAAGDSATKGGAADPGLSNAQERLWLLHQMHPDLSAYIVPCHLRLRGRLDRVAFEEALQSLWSRHESLRAVFPTRDGKPAKVVLPAAKLVIHEHDFGGAADSGAWERHYLAHHAGAFNLGEGPLFQVCLYRLGPDEHALLIDVHHINCDGQSLEILKDDLFDGYNAVLAGRRIDSPGSARYDDYVAREHVLQQDAEYRRSVEHRIKSLSGAPTRIGFPFDKPPPAEFSHRGALLVRRFDRAVVARALERGQAAGLSPFMVFLAAYGMLLHRHTGQEDLLVGVPVSVRGEERFERTVGFCVNTGVVRLDFRGNPSLGEMMTRTRKAAAEMLACPGLPLDVLVRSLPGARPAGRPPLVQAAFSYLPGRDRAPMAPKGLAVEPILLRRDGTMFELTMDVVEQDGGFACDVEYATDVWEEPSVARMLDHFETIIAALAGDPERNVREIDLAGARSSAAGSKTREGEPLAPDGGRVVDTLLDHAARRPGSVALVCGGADVTYAGLASRVSVRRGQIRALGLKPGSVLALACAAGFEWTATALAAMAEAVAVLPLDVDAPSARLVRLLADSGAALLWHDERFDPRSLGESAPCRAVDHRTLPDAAPVLAPPVAGADATAYIIYTSGTSGRPKGVRVGHAAFAAHCRSAVHAWGLTAGDRALAFAAVCFDAFWEQLFAPLFAGASVLVRDPLPWSPDELSARLVEFRVTCADLPPLYLRELLYFWGQHPDRVPRTLRIVIAGGEPMPSALARAWRDGPLGDVPLVNAYGPTEAVVTSLRYRVERDARISTANGVVPIGRPLPGRVVRVLDAEGREVGAGIAGELCIGGPCLADGYHGDEVLTARAFRGWRRTAAGGQWVDDSEAGAIRLYRTGDRVRLGPDDQLEFLGRIDRQVKLRGFRIEPGEIEAVLARHPAVAQSVVVLVDDPATGAQLAAYCVPAVDRPPAEREMLDWLGQALPAHMVPASLLFLRELPTTTSGKVDAAALPRPAVPPTESAESDPADGLEAKVAALWADVLGRPRVGVNENFFDLGGHSLLLVRLHTRLVSELGAKVPLVGLFANPTVARMTQLLRGGASERAVRRSRRRGGDVAVIGMSGRFPGAANVDELWANLVAGRESIRFFSPAELAAEGVPESLCGRSDYVPAHGHLDGVKLFDAGFFGYTPKEAQTIDPQQRLFLEEAWHALEHAGYDPARCKGDIGVFGGMGMGLYLSTHLAHLLQEGRGAEAYAISLGNDKDFITTRVSYKLDLRGPSVNVNTACSTSLVAVHLAAEALLRHECDLALAGGVTLSLPPAAGYVFQPGGIASPDGHCRAFADDAAGTVGGSGVALVVLKRLEQALEDGDTIHAVIKGSAINNDGADKVGFTAPGVNRQRDVIRAALDCAGVGAGTVQYIEAHGTGTAMGDPIEVQALSQAFTPDHPARQGCYLGSIKSNIGHLDTAAGVAGFIKAVLALKHGVIPPTLHCGTPSRQIGFADTPFRIVRELTPWPAGSSTRRAGVSSFGMGGTNAHVVLEEPPPVVATAAAAPRPDVWCLPLSARSAPSLLAFARNLAAHLESHPALDPAAVWFTLADGRRRFPIRTVVLASSREQAVAALRALGEQDLRHADRDGDRIPAILPLTVDDGTGQARAFADAWLAGGNVSAGAFLPRASCRRVPLPTYVFDHEVCWVDAPVAPPDAPAARDAAEPGKRALDAWLHFPRWERIPLARADLASDVPELVIHRGTAIEARWMEVLRAAGGSVTACRAGDAGAALAALPDAPAAVVCWHLAALGHDAGGAEEYAQRLDSLLADIRALSEAQRGRPVTLVLCCPPAGGPDAVPDPAVAYLDAVAAVLPHEYPSLGVRVLRIDPAATDVRSLQAARLTARVSGDDRALAVVNGKPWRKSVAPLPATGPAAGAARFPERGVCLISGGLGGIGLTLARHLVRAHRARLVLVSRHEPRDGERDLLREFEQAGAEVRTAVLDVADVAALRALVDDVCRHWGRISGVIHAAGVAGGALVARTRHDEIERVLRAKVAGTLALADALRDREPDFVLLCSSLTASVGGPGQIAYAAANAWMDAYAAAQAERRPGVWTSVQWDAWSEVGMAARAAEHGLAAANRRLLCEWDISPASFWPWGEHRVGGAAVLPGTAYLELFAQALGGSEPVALAAVALREPIVHAGESSRRVRVLRDGDDLILESGMEAGWSENARARLAGAVEPAALAPLPEIEARCAPVTDAVRREEAPGIVIEAGARWQIEGSYLLGNDEALARLALPASCVGDLAAHALHPALLDVALSYFIAFVEGGTGLLPWRYEQVRVFAPLTARVLAHARLRSRSDRALVLDVDVRDESGLLLVRVEGYTLIRAEAGVAAGPPPVRDGSDRRLNPFAMTPAEGVEVFQRVLATAEPVVCVSTVDWEEARRVAPVAAPGRDGGHAAEAAGSARKPRPETATPYRAPGTETEALLASIWAEVLGFERVGMDDDLFDLGADSLVALQASARLKESTGAELPLERFFAQPTIAHLAEGLGPVAAPAAPPARDGAWEEGDL